MFTESKAPSPKEGEFKTLWKGMQELKEQGKRVNQAELIKHLKGCLSENKIRDRLKDEEGKMFWDAIPREKNETLYEPKMVEWQDIYSYHSTILENEGNSGGCNENILNLLRG